MRRTRIEKRSPVRTILPFGSELYYWVGSCRNACESNKIKIEPFPNELFASIGKDYFAHFAPVKLVGRKGFIYTRLGK